MGLFTHRHPESAEAVDPRHQHEYKAPESTWRTGCDVCGQLPDDPRHLMTKAPNEPQVQSEFNWPT